MARVRGSFWKKTADALVQSDIIPVIFKQYINFGTTPGESGYGFRDNAGVIQFKNSAGAWLDIGVGGGGIANVVEDVTPQLGGDLDANGNDIVNIPSLDFDTTQTTNAALGEMRYDADMENFVFGVDGTSIPLNQPFYYVRNSTGATLTKGTPVYATGTLGASGRITVGKFIADGSIAGKYYLGVLHSDVLNGADGLAITQGTLRGIDTSAFTDGQVLYVSSTVAGTFVSTEPAAPNLSIATAFVIYAHATTGSIAVRATPGVVVDDISDLTASATELNYMDGVTSAVQTQLNAKEASTNKATDFSTVNDTLYPTVEAVQEYVTAAVVGLLDYRGTYDASTNLFPATGGSGLAGAVLKGDFWIVSVAGTLGGVAVDSGDLVISLVDTPAQTSSNWDIVSNTGGGGGDVTKVGTPVNNQVGVWTGDGTIEGDAALTFDTTTNTLATEIVTVTDEAYDATGWNADLSVPTKNAVRDVIDPIKTKVDNITITQAVDLDALETASHAAVTATDSTSIDITVTAQDISAQREALTGAITAPKNSNATSLGSFTIAQLNTAISDANIVPEAGGTFTGDISVPDEAYGAGWNGSLEAPTKNAVYDKIETIAGTKAKVCASKSGTQAVNATTAQVTFDVEDIDTGGDFASNQFTAPRTSIYLINFFCSYDSNASSSEITNFEVRVNGTAVFRGQSTTASSTTGEGQQVTISALRSLTASDVVTVYCTASGHNATLLATTNTKFSILET